MKTKIACLGQIYDWKTTFFIRAAAFPHGECVWSARHRWLPWRSPGWQLRRSRCRLWAPECLYVEDLPPFPRNDRLPCYPHPECGRTSVLWAALWTLRPTLIIINEIVSLLCDIIRVSWQKVLRTGGGTDTSWFCVKKTTAFLLLSRKYSYIYIEFLQKYLDVW